LRGHRYIVQSRRDKKAAKRLFRKLLKKQGRAPRVLVTDKLKSYAAAKPEILPGIALFPAGRDHDTAANLRSDRTQAFARWADVTGVLWRHNHPSCPVPTSPSRFLAICECQVDGAAE
jgi:transposase-like protein